MWVVSSLNDKYIFVMFMVYHKVGISLSHIWRSLVSYAIRFFTFQLRFAHNQARCDRVLFEKCKERRLPGELESLNNSHSPRYAPDYVCRCYTTFLDNWLINWLTHGHGLIDWTSNTATRANNYIPTFVTFTLYYIFCVLRLSCRDNVVQLLFLISMTSASHYIQNRLAVIMSVGEVCPAPDAPHATYVCYEQISLNTLHSMGLRTVLGARFSSLSRDA